MNETKFKLIEQYNNENYEFINECESKLKHLKVMTVSPELNNLIDVISQQSPKMLVIDTIDEIRVDYANDPLVKIQKIVSKLKEIAQTNDIMIFVISHISKSASYEGILDKHSAKGDSAIEQKSDKLLGITAPSSNSKARVVESIAARDESNFKLKFWFNHETFRFDQVVDKQVEEGESKA
jgi:RecA-family ATPase